MYERIRNLREDQDISQKQMGELLSVAQTTYSDYERGKINIPLATLVRIAQQFNTSTDYLLELTDEPAPYPRRKKTGT